MAEAPELNTKVRNLDMLERKDLGLIRVACGSTGKRRWPVDDDLKSEAVVALRNALRIAQAQTGDDYDGSLVDRIVKTIGFLEAQNQSDEHLEIKHQRLDEGKATDAVEHYVVEMPRPRNLGSASESLE